MIMRTWIVILKVMWVSMDLVFAATESKVRWFWVFKNWSKWLIKSKTLHSPLTETCKSTTLDSDKLDLPTFVISTPTLSFPSHDLIMPSDFISCLTNSASSISFFFLTSSSWPFKEAKYSVVLARTDALSFCRSTN